MALTMTDVHFMHCMSTTGMILRLGKNCSGGYLVLCLPLSNNVANCGRQSQSIAEFASAILFVPGNSEVGGCVNDVSMQSGGSDWPSG